MKNVFGKRTGFTLVELLVVIGILAMLMALLTPAIFRALASSKTAAIKAEIDMLHMAIINYKNEYGAYPPCIDLTVTGDGSGPGVKHIRRLFVRCSNPQVQLALALTNKTNTVLALTPNNAMWVWLSGYTGDATSPIDPTPNRKRLYDFDMLRIDQGAGTYSPSYGKGTPYIYLDSSRYQMVDTQTIGGGKCFVWRNDKSFNPNGTAPAAPLADSTGYFNPDTFQIISAGLDGEYFTDDDLSNAWPATWGEYKSQM